LDFRYRLELVEQDNLDKEAVASTARLRLGLTSAQCQQAVVEGVGCLVGHRLRLKLRLQARTSM